MSYANPVVTFVVRDLPTTIRFYQEAFGFQVFNASDSVATLTYQGAYYTFYTEAYAREHFGQEAQSPSTSGLRPSVMPTIWTENVNETIQRSASAGARYEAQRNDQKVGYHFVTVVDPEGYYWRVSDCNDQASWNAAYFQGTAQGEQSTEDTQD
jgi:uncharacterized glyoxalase superfamily protein PhnB